jgi:hypothetical protein
MSESVDILIKAEDMATPVVAKSAKAIDSLDASIKKFKTSGEQAKKSTEFFGQIANVLGGSEIAGFAGQLAGLTEKTSQFSEVQKLGGAGAFAFKAGLAAAAGAIGFQLGNALGNAIFQTEMWKKKLADATAEAGRLESQIVKLQARRFGETKSDIELIRDPEGKKAAYADLFRLTVNEMKGVERQLHEAKKAVDAYDASWFPEWLQGNNDLMEDQLKTAREKLQVLSDQRDEVHAERLAREAANKEIEKQNALQDKSDEYLKSLRDEVELLKATKEEQAGILAIRNAVGQQAQEEAKALLLEKQRIELEQEATKQREADAQKEKQDQENILKASFDYVQSLKDQLALLKATDSERAALQAGQKAVGTDVAAAEALLKEIDSIKTLAEFEKMRESELQKIQGEKEADAKRLADLKQNELDKLEEERILLQQGAEAAQAFRLAKQGLSEADAKSIARQQAELDKLKEANKPGKVVKQDIPELKAFESRVLTRGGSGEDPSKITARGMTEAVKELQALNKKLMDQKKDLLTLKVVKR